MSQTIDVSTNESIDRQAEQAHMVNFCNGLLSLIDSIQTIDEVPALDHLLSTQSPSVRNQVKMGLYLPLANSHNFKPRITELDNLRQELIHSLSNLNARLGKTFESEYGLLKPVAQIGMMLHIEEDHVLDFMLGVDPGIAYMLMNSGSDKTFGEIIQQKSMFRERRIILRKLQAIISNI